MSFLLRLADRTLGHAPALRPLLAPRFAPEPVAAARRPIVAEAAADLEASSVHAAARTGADGADTLDGAGARFAQPRAAWSPAAAAREPQSDTTRSPTAAAALAQARPVAGTHDETPSDDPPPPPPRRHGDLLVPSHGTKGARLDAGDAPATSDALPSRASRATADDGARARRFATPADAATRSASDMTMSRSRSDRAASDDTGDTPGSGPHQDRGFVTSFSDAGARDGAPAWQGSRAGAAPTVQVTIGRVEVRAVMPSPPSRAPRPAATSAARGAISLDDYLHARDRREPR